MLKVRRDFGFQNANDFGAHKLCQILERLPDDSIYETESDPIYDLGVYVLSQRVHDEL